MTSVTYSACPNCLRINRIPLQGAQSAQKEPICGICKTTLAINQDINELDARTLSTLIAKSPLPVVVDFWAPWCGPCRSFAPTFMQAAQQLGGSFVFAKVNTETHPDAATPFGIRGIPTLMVFDQGKEMNRASGALPLPDFLRWLSPHSRRSAA